jgi:ligand-binding sensor domain-containing protein
MPCRWFIQRLNPVRQRRYLLIKAVYFRSDTKPFCLPATNKYGLLLFFMLPGTLPVAAQQLSFKHLGIEEGMPSNNTNRACFDSTGLFWIGTNDGLINFDGSRIKQYLKETHPGLPVNDIGNLFCDSRNRIWICTDAGLALMDEQRRVKRIIISDTIKNKDINYCFEVAGVGIVAIAARQSYLLPENKSTWVPYTWFDETIRKGKAISEIKLFDKQSGMFIMGKSVMLVNFAAGKIVSAITIENPVSINKLNSGELLAADGDSFTLYRINIATNTISKKYTDIKDNEGHTILSNIISTNMAANGIVYISTQSEGLIGFDVNTGTCYRYQHLPLNRSSISFNSLRRVYCHPNGYMMITSVKGLNFTNVLTPMLQQLTTFIDDKGTITDGVSTAAEDASGRIWFRSFDNLLIWDRKKNSVKNISPPRVFTSISETNPALGRIFRDNKNNMWVAYGGKGLFQFDASGRLLHSFNDKKSSVSTNSIRTFCQLQDKRLLAATDNGLLIINTETLTADTLTDHPLLKPLSKKRIVNLMVDNGDVWIAVSPNGAAYCYNFQTKKLRNITVADGLSSDRVYCFEKDLQKNIYIGTYDGLNILAPDGKITVINKTNGLRHPRVENILRDGMGRLWITNFNCLICYNPANKSFIYFDEQNGVNNSGFALGQSIIAKDGKLIFCNDGLLIADTALAVAQKKFIPQITINRLYDDGGYDLIKPSSTVNLKYNEAKVSLYYLTNTLITANRFFYRYKMDNLDNGWQQPTKNNEVTYNLKPGTYTFHIQASSTETDWQQTGSGFTIIVTPPWWQTWWFRLCAALFLASILYLVFRQRIKDIKAKAAIKQQMTELEGKALRAQMNPHFIFNSLNAIQELIVTKNFDEGYQYLSNFSKLLRMVLNSSEKKLIPLSIEIEIIKLQLSLESLRFKNSFTYSITVDPLIEADLTNVPPLLLQPYVENAIWHGLRHKAGEKKLWIRITEKEEKLDIEIEDNGVGLKKAEEIKKQKMGAQQFESKGSMLSQQRISLLNKEYPGAAAVAVIDMNNESTGASGTTIKISLPVNLK